MQNIHLAGCVIQDNAGKILLLHRNTAKRTQWEIPGGKIDEGENPGKTASREADEELGVKVAMQRELGGRSFTEDGYTMQYTWFSAKIVSGTPKIMEPETHDDCQFFDVESLKDLSEELSPNAINFLEELEAKRIVL